MTIEKLNEITVNIIANMNTWPPAISGGKECKESMLACVDGIMTLRSEIENAIRKEEEEKEVGKRNEEHTGKVSRVNGIQ